MAFTGIPPEAITFYEQLEADNSGAFWDANRATFKSAVREPCEELCAALAEFGPFHLFRPHNDLRFSKTKPPYKTHQGCYSESEGGAGFYFHVSATGLMCATGYYAMAKDQLERFRKAVDGPATGAEVEAIVGKLARRGYTIGAIDELKTAPRGYPADHPRVALLRRKGLMASKDFGITPWLHTKQAATKIRTAWRDAADLNAWLDTHVGPSILEPEGFFR
jgi:uncharacterized protein (TIGR02453 family)